MVAVEKQIITPYHQTDRFSLYEGDCREIMRSLADNSVDAIVTDPPYELTSNKKGGTGIASVNLDSPYGRARITTGFMGKAWDGTGVPFMVDTWAEALRVLKPGGHLLAFGGSRTYHRLACAIEDAGFEIRDQIQWIYGSGFPKSLDVSKAIDGAAGAEREVVGVSVYSSRRPQPAVKEGVFSNQGPNLGGPGSCDLSAPATDAAKQWSGWGTALKPAHEPIVLARKPLIGTVAENVLQHGTGALNIDGCRIEALDGKPVFINGVERNRNRSSYDTGGSNRTGEITIEGRWPSNVCHDGSDEVLAGFPETASNGGGTSSTGFWQRDGRKQPIGDGDSGSAARFFYCAKSSQEDRSEGLEDLPLQSAGTVTDRKDGSTGLNSPRAGAGRTNGSRNHHPTVKPTELMRYLCRLITPPGGLVLDPFCGSGSTGKGAMLEGLRFVGIELNAEYCELAQRRIEAVTKQGLLFA